VKSEPFIKRSVYFRLIPGSLSILFYILYVAYYASHNKLYNMVWVCHVGSLLVGLGLVFRKPLLNATGFFWVSIGIPLWVYNLTSGSSSVIYSYLTHWGGLINGLLGIYIMGIPKRSYIYSAIALSVFACATRFITPPGENINLIHSIWPGWETVFPSFPVFLAIIFFYCIIVFFLIEYAYSRLK
jgi:hypothetical protein